MRTCARGACMKSKKAIGIAIGMFVIAATAAIAMSAKGKSKGKFVDGEWPGKGEGRNGPIELILSVKGGKITGAKVTKESETGFAQPAEQFVIDQAVAKQSVEGLDTMSGATITSNATIAALQAAIKASKGETTTAAKATDTSCDIVIIGAGGAGLTAATEAAHRGAKVIVLEKMGIVGGNTNSATGGLNAAYTKEQEKLGIKDSKEQFFEDTMKGGKNLNDPALVHTLVDNSAAIVEWLQSDIVGADLSDVGLFGGATNKRIHRPQGGAAIGSHLVPLLYAAAQKQGADVRLNNKVTDIFAENGKPAGVTVTSPNGDYKIKAKAIIIATGGFGANSDMVVKYNPKLAGFGTTNHPGATGDAFEWIKKFDGALTQMEQIQTHPTVVPGKGIMITEAVRGNGAILVSRTGKRFINEMETRDVVSAAILKEPNKTAFLVFDQDVRASLKAIEGYAKKGLLTEAATPAELAQKLGIPAAEFEKTLKTYADYVHNKKDADFNRNPNGLERDLTKGPYYAIEIGPAVHHTMGGIKIDTKTEVLNTKGNAIPGLFAAGEVTGGVHGANRLGGNAVADIEVFGKIAGDAACDYIKK